MSNQIALENQRSLWLYKVCWFCWILLGLGDILTTYFGIRTFGCREKNDFLFNVIGVSNPINHIIFLLSFIAICFCIIEFLRRKSFQKIKSPEVRDLLIYFFSAVPFAFSLAFFLLVINNANCIIQHT